ncbi:MAG: hypothetical protein ABIO38_06990 [Luteimonas sp.]
MAGTSSGDWAEASALFDSVIEMPEADRAAALAGSKAPTGVKERVNAMIAALEASPGFLDHPPVLHGPVQAGGMSRMGEPGPKVDSRHDPDCADSPP